MADHLLLFALAFLAGLVDAVAGGGGIIQLPALFLNLPRVAPGSTLVMALATNKFASFCGTALAVFRYLWRVAIPWRLVAPVLVGAGAFSWMGSQVAMAVPPDRFRPLVLVLLIAVFVFVLWSRDFGLKPRKRSFSPWKQISIGFFMGAAIGFYDGFFGPGTGTFLMFGFVLVFGLEFLVATACTKVINAVTNASALASFALAGQVVYSIAIPMAVFNIAGAWAGTHLAMTRGSRFVRLVFLLVVGVLMVKMCWETLQG